MKRKIKPLIVGFSVLIVLLCGVFGNSVMKWRGHTMTRDGQPASSEESIVNVPILCYHHLIDSGEAGGVLMTVPVFTEQMKALKAAGYEPVDIRQMRDFVEKGSRLPEKPALITFDDGYESFYTLAYPILKELDFKATVFVIGVSIGSKDTYKDTGLPITPHFSLDEAREMTASGLITVASHGYDVHEVEGVDPDPVRRGLLIKEGESEEEYAEFLTADALHMRELLGESAGFFAYPYSCHDSRSLAILARAGVFATVCLDNQEADNYLVKGIPQCLYDMPRFMVTEDTTGEQLIDTIRSYDSTVKIP